jgi:hypothetical protein
MSLGPGGAGTFAIPDWPLGRGAFMRLRCPLARLVYLKKRLFVDIDAPPLPSPPPPSCHMDCSRTWPDPHNYSQPDQGRNIDTIMLRHRGVDAVCCTLRHANKAEKVPPRAQMGHQKAKKSNGCSTVQMPYLLAARAYLTASVANSHVTILIHILRK